MTEKIIDYRKIKADILRLALPITLESILQMTAGIVSMALVGRISGIAVAAVGLSQIIFRIIWALLKGLGTGTSVFVAQCHGADDIEGVRRVSQQGILLGILFAIIFQQIVFWNAESMLSFFKPSHSLLLEATQYLKIISWSLIPTAIMLISTGLFQGKANARTPMLIVALLNILVISFSYSLIYGKFGFPKLGLMGAAIAFTISYYIAATVAMIVTINRERIFNPTGNKIEISLEKQDCYKLLRFSFPTALEMSFWQFSSVVVSRAILTFGEAPYAAYQLGLQAESISYMPAAGFGIAATTFVGQAVGKGKLSLGKAYLNHLIKITTIVTGLVSIALIFFPKQTMSLLTDNTELIAIGAFYLFVMGLIQIPQNLAAMINGALRGAGYSREPMLNVFFCIWIIRVPLILISTYVLNLSIEWIWYIMALDILFRILLAFITLKRKDIFNNAVFLDRK